MADAAPSFLDRQRAARPWLDHLSERAVATSSRRATTTPPDPRLTILAIVPILMVAFAVAGFALAGNRSGSTRSRTRSATTMPGGLGETVNGLIDSAISARTSVGVFGLLGAAYAGIGWITNLRDALTAMWEHTHEAGNFVITKLKDFGALLGLGGAMLVTFGLSALSNGPVARQVVEWLGVEHVTGVGVLLRITSLAISVLATWALLSWVIARMPREAVTLAQRRTRCVRSGDRLRGLPSGSGPSISRQVSQGPAGAAFGDHRSPRIREPQRAPHPVRHRVGRHRPGESRECVRPAARPPPSSASRRGTGRASAKEALALTGAGAPRGDRVGGPVAATGRLSLVTPAAAGECPSPAQQTQTMPDPTMPIATRPAPPCSAAGPNPTPDPCPRTVVSGPATWTAGSSALRIPQDAHGDGGSSAQP